VVQKVEPGQYYKLNMGFHVAMLDLRQDVPSSAFRAVHQDTRAWEDFEPLFVGDTQGNSSGRQPISGRRPPSRHVSPIKQFQLGTRSTEILKTTAIEQNHYDRSGDNVSSLG